MTAGFCPQCGSGRSGDLRYCANCGFDFSSTPQGQTASVAPTTPVAPATGQAVAQPSGRQWNASNIGLIAAGVALVVAPLLPFVTATAAFVGTLTRSGVELVGLEAFLLSVFGALLIATGVQRAGGKKIGRALPIVASLGAALLTGWYFSQVSERVDRIGSDVGVASIGVGLWLAVGGAIVGLLLSLRRPDASWT